MNRNGTKVGNKLRLADRASGGNGRERRLGGRAGRAQQTHPGLFTEMCSGSEAGSYLRLIDFVYDSSQGLRVIEKNKREVGCSQLRNEEPLYSHLCTRFQK